MISCRRRGPDFRDQFDLNFAAIASAPRARMPTSEPMPTKVAPASIQCLRHRFVGENAGEFPGLQNLLDRLLDDRLHVGTRALAGIAERSVQIGRADEQSVDAVDRGDGFHIVERFARFDLEDDAKLFMRGLEIVLDAPEARAARRARDAAQSVRRIAGEGNRVARLFARY